MSRRTLYLIDGHAQIYRAYYAPFGNLTAPTGEPTRATHVFLQMLFGILYDRRPDYLAMTMDCADETVFRVQIDSTYKQNRQPPPEDLPPQMDRIVSILQAVGIPILRLQGFEADDILATLCHRLTGEDVDVYLVSRDKDLDQLLADRVRLYDPGKDRVIAVADMVEEKGYGPAQAVEAQMLMGDSTDNVRGVPGVGPKKAAQLLQKYGCVAEILAHADELTPKLRENILAFRERAETVRRLVTLRKDVPIGFDLADAAVSRFDLAAAIPILDELGLNRLLDRISNQTRARESSANRPSPTPRTADPTAHSSETPAGRPSAAASPAGQKTRSRQAAATGPSLFAEDAEQAVQPDSAPAAGSAPTAQADGETARQDQEASRSGGQVAMGLFPDRAAAPAPGTQEGQSTLIDVTQSPGRYELVDTIEALDGLARKLAAVPVFAFDTETTGLVPATADLVGLSFSWESGRGYYVPVRGVGRTVPVEAVRERIGPVLADPGVRKCGQNVKYDLVVLKSAGMAVAGVDFDTMIASFVLDSSRRSHSLDALSTELLRYRPIPAHELIGKGKKQTTFDQLPTDRVCQYAAEDADVAWRLRRVLERQMTDPELTALFRDLEMPLAEVLADVESRGVAVDTELLAGLSNRLADRLRELEHEIHVAAGRPFNIQSTKQLAEVLFDERGMRSVKRTKTTRSTDAEVLETLAAETTDPIPRLVLEHREFSKLKSTYVDALPEMVSPRTGRIHPSFHQTGAVTGRLSCSEPNLQNIPIRTDLGAHVRRAFVPGRPGWRLLKADYSQIELRVLAHFCRDEVLGRAFREDRDIHAFVAAQIEGVPLEQVTKQQRARAKTVNFGIVYGQSAFGLSRQTGMPVSEAKRFIERYFNRYPRIRGFLDQCVADARRCGFVKTIMGRRRAIPDINSRNQTARQAAERFAANTVIQGSAADLIKKAMIDIHREVVAGRRPCEMLIQVHDELVFELPAEAVEEEARMIASRMSGALPLDVPIKVDVASGPNWLDVQ